MIDILVLNQAASQGVIITVRVRPETTAHGEKSHHGKYSDDDANLLYGVTQND